MTSHRELIVDTSFKFVGPQYCNIALTVNILLKLSTNGAIQIPTNHGTKPALINIVSYSNFSEE